MGSYLLGLSVADLTLDWFVLLALGITFPFIAIVSGNVTRFLIALMVFDLSLALDVQIFPQPIQASVDSLYISLTTLSLICAYALWIARLLSGRGKFNIFASISLPALLFIVTGLLSVQNSENQSLSALEIVLNIELFLMFIYIANHIQSLEDIKFILRILLIGLLVTAISVLAVYFVGGFRFMGLGGETLEIGSERFVRSGGLLGHPNAAATYLAATTMMVLALIFTVGDAAFGKALALAAVGLGVVALILTFSRGGWVNLAVAGMIFAFLALHRKWLRWQHLVLLATILGLLLFMFREPILHRIFYSDYGSALSRIPLNIIAINMIKSHPWIGVGINNFMVVAANYLTPETYEAWLAPAHNKYLLVWSETGTIGILSFILFFLAVAREAWRNYRSDHRVVSVLGAALLAGLAGYAIHMLVDRFGSRRPLQLLWFIAALAIGTNRVRIGAALAGRSSWKRVLKPSPTTS